MKIKGTIRDINNDLIYINYDEEEDLCVNINQWKSEDKPSINDDVEFEIYNEINGEKQVRNVTFLMINKKTKTEATEKIKKIIVGEKDFSGNTIIEILAKYNEYVIYEIKTSDINNRLRVFIDGHSDSSEKTLTDKFNKVKQKYIEAKGLLYRSQNYGTMKNRVAHALSTALLSDSENPITEFQELINQIKQESKDALVNRIFYLLSGVIVSVLLFLIIFFSCEQISIFSVLFGGTLGGVLSLLIFVNNKHFEEFTKGYYFMLGFERIFLSNITAIIVYVLIKAGIVLPSLMDSNTWMTISIGIIAGFSETLAPSLINKIEQNNK